MKKIKEGSGFIIVKNINGENKFLSLIVDGKYDIPKGMIEPGESYLEAAVRECFEESNIVVLPSDMIWGLDYSYNSSIAIFMARTDQEPKIFPNPNNGMMEHDYAQWMDPMDLYTNCIPYLKKSIMWAIKKIGE